MQELTSTLIAKAKELLSSGKVQKVIGWKKGLFDEDVTPATFRTAEELDKDFVFNKYCTANLSKYLVKITKDIEIAKSTTRMNNTMAKQRDPNAEDKPIPQEVAAVFLKPGDTYSFTQLLKESRIARDDVYVIGIPCSCTLDENVKEGEGCDHCHNKKHILYDELIGEDGVIVDEHRFDEVARVEAMDPKERFEFWRNELSRCIRCNACRNICPACTCEKCVFDNNDLYTSQKVAQSDFEENLFHIIRAWHVAGRCTDCGECSRVCPQNIPLYLLNRKFIKDINEIYGEYQAGSDLETKPPMLTFTTGDAEPSIVADRDPIKGGEE
ncbi:4Fe-4S dicluster domain-containing protein [Treponema sp.]|uniref:4Fe-4S dicluster domain-containing protein n=1 Tax=Treponema sp. TaxID=166 RepID=UPI0025D18654|nr:4Fe-4S dicluster domain-containing protein [Treponema sp.]MCR5218074.1 4Fe-4S dicluster domain-containing protein [Treponema sp.]